jgi:anthranilate 1,2-dioxygenase small subunit
VTERERLRAWRPVVEEFLAEYCATLDAGKISLWPEFFAEDAVYRVTARDNEEAGLPLDLMSCEGQGMLRDRAYAIAHTEMYAPRWVRHQVTNLRILAETDGLIEAVSNYALFETLVDAPTKLLQVGESHDKLQVQPDGSLLIVQRHCVFDSVMIDNCVVFPP